MWSSGWQIRSDRVATLAEFNEMLRLCDEAGPACAFATPEGSAARWEKVAEAVRARPVDLGGGDLYTYDRLIGDAAGAMYVPRRGAARTGTSPSSTRSPMRPSATTRRLGLPRGGRHCSTG